MIIGQDGGTALMYASMKGSLAIVEALVEHGADLNIEAKVH
jgi:ankyrin repeat protein